MESCPCSQTCCVWAGEAAFWAWAWAVRVEQAEGDGRPFESPAHTRGHTRYERVLLETCMKEANETKGGVVMDARG